MAPLMHDFYYQALAYDLLNIENDIIELPEKTKDQISLKKHNLQQNIPFQKYKYDHVAKVLTDIPQETK